ncbi:MAG: chemotaxis protein CheW [Gammaproteobacteria bacterium]|nr:chemotaxis protein CheW [Gammaproteobacteria bacterium]
MPMSQSAQTRSDPVSRWVTFKLENETYGIDVMQVREVLRCSEISPVPGAPAYVLGIINLRGSVVSIIDTRSRFGLAFKEPDDAARILILEAGEEHVVGFLVDSVHEVMQLRAAEMESAPDTGSGETARFIMGLANRKDGLLILVDASKLLSDEELAELSTL